MPSSRRSPSSRRTRASSARAAARREALRQHRARGCPASARRTLWSARWPLSHRAPESRRPEHPRRAVEARPPALLLQVRAPRCAPPAPPVRPPALPTLPPRAAPPADHDHGFALQWKHLPSGFLSQPRNRLPLIPTSIEIHWSDSTLSVAPPNASALRRANSKKLVGST